MIASFIITFRETLEAALIVGIILSYLVRTKQTKYNNVVYLGVVVGIVASILGAFLFNTFAGGFSGTTEEIFEGITMIVGAILLTTMILWMMKQKQLAKELEANVKKKIALASRYGLFLLVFIAVLREGIETVIFLGAANFVSSGNGLLGAVAGIFAAIILGYLIFVGSMKINLRKFFTITSILLILFAAGLVAHGVHEFQEAGVIPVVAEHIWDINPPAPLEDQGIYPTWHEKGNAGSILKGLFGYNGNPNLLEVISYIFYLGIVFAFWRRIEMRNGK